MTQLYLLPVEEARALPAAFCARWFPARVRRAEKCRRTRRRSALPPGR